MSALAKATTHRKRWETIRCSQITRIFRSLQVWMTKFAISGKRETACVTWVTNGTSSFSLFCFPQLRYSIRNDTTFFRFYTDWNNEIKEDISTSLLTICVFIPARCIKCTVKTIELTRYTTLSSESADSPSNSGKKKRKRKEYEIRHSRKCYRKKFEERRLHVRAGQRLAQLTPGTPPGSVGNAANAKQAKVQADVVRIKHMDVSFPGDIITTLQLSRSESPPTPASDR